MVLILASLVATEGMLHGLVGCEVDSMRRPYSCQSLFAPSCDYHHEPAPSTTLDNPLHNVRKPSTRDIVIIALEIPLYIAVGDGLTTCILV